MKSLQKKVHKSYFDICEMDRFEWGDTNLVPGEEQVNFQTGIAIYDGQDKVNAKYLS